MLFPFALLYGVAVYARNWLFDKKIFKSSKFNFPVICVGNLSLGGTGKTPMVEYLIGFLKDRYQVATISRGYKRRTKGFGIAGEHTTALDIGDEPMQFHLKFPNVSVAVGEERLVAIPQLLQDRPDTSLIILDDAFQHRYVQAGFNILLTDYSNLYTRDFLLPAGDLRDARKSAARADSIIVTKCPNKISTIQMDAIIKELNATISQTVFFTYIKYESLVHFYTRNRLELDSGMHVLLVCGIANPNPIKAYLNEKVATYDMIKFPDHHIFDSDDLKDILIQFHKIPAHNKIILTTEKDEVRLHKFQTELIDIPVYVLPISHVFLNDGAELFQKKVIDFVESYK